MKAEGCRLQLVPEDATDSEKLGNCQDPNYCVCQPREQVHDYAGLVNSSGFLVVTDWPAGGRVCGTPCGPTVVVRAQL